MSSARIYIMTHTVFMKPEDSVYEPIHVGRDVAQDLGYRGDNTGDNISEFNPLFGELTGIYWLWKNLPEDAADYVGICHYRRYFKGEDGNPVGEEEVLRWMKDYDVVTSNLNSPGDGTVYEYYGKVHHIEDLDYTIESLKKLYPEYAEDADAIMNASESCYGNLMIVSRENYDAYCQWMFSILFDAAEKIDPTDYDIYTKRVYGFLSERLLNIWVHYQNRVNGYRVKNQSIIYTQEKSETVLLKKSAEELFREDKIEEAYQLFEQFVSLRPDVMFAASDLLGELPIIRQILYTTKLVRENGGKIFASDCKDLSDAISKYRDVYWALNSIGTNNRSHYMSSTDAVAFLRREKVNPILIEVILQNDLYDLFQTEPLNVDLVREAIRE